MAVGNTIGICAYNEGRSIEKALLSILPQLSNKDELIVVASGCTDNTVPVVQGLAKHEPRIRLIIERERGGKARAINLILHAAKGGNIVLTDADVVLGAGAIRRLVMPISQGAGAVLGRTVPYQQEGFFDNMQAFAWDAFHRTRVRQSESGELFALNGYLSAVKRGIVNEIPEDNLVEDWLLGWMVRQQGHAVIYAPEAKVYVKAAQNLSDYIKQKSRIRLGQWQMREKGMPIKYVRRPAHLAELLGSRYALPYLALDLFAWGKSFMDFKMGKRYWEQVKSSKI